MKTYKTYQARNAVKAAQVTNHIIAAKKLGETHSNAKAEAYRLYNIKKAIPILKKYFSVNENRSPVVQLPPLPPLPVINTPFPVLPPLPNSGLATSPPAELVEEWASDNS
jgi:hypothetical protein